MLGSSACSLEVVTSVVFTSSFLLSPLSWLLVIWTLISFSQQLSFPELFAEFLR